MPADAPVPPPPEDPDALLAWAEAHEVTERLDDVLIGDGPSGAVLPGRPGETLTYRQILLGQEADGPGLRRPHDAEETARRVLHRLATLAAAQRAAQAWADEQGRDPADETLVELLERVRERRRALSAMAQRPTGTFEPVRLRILRLPVPTLRYEEWPLTGPRGRGADAFLLPLLGWREGPLRWSEARGDEPPSPEAPEAPPERQLGACDALVDLLRDPERAAEQEELAALLHLPAWQFALGTLDERLARLAPEVAAPERPTERIAFRVSVGAGGALQVDPLLQKRTSGGAFSKGARLQWFELPERRNLGAAERRAYQAFDDRFARRSSAWGGTLAPGQVFGILAALLDHPAVFLEGGREGERLEIRLGRLRLRFVGARDGTLSPQFDLVGVALLPHEVAQALRDDRHLMHLHRPERGAPQLLLAQLTPQAAALVQALALTPARFPPEAHDALAARLESLQEAVDIEFPSRWTRTVGLADGRLVARLELLASGAIEVRLCVRPVKLGPTFPPGEGPALLLEGQGEARHGARRDRQAERQAGRALAERLGLDDGAESEPWCWRVPAGDPALHLVATLAEARDEVGVEWADDARLIARGTVGRGAVRLKVADRREWLAIQGGAEVDGEIVPLPALFAAIREGRRYVPVGRHGFARIEEQLRDALLAAEPLVALRADEVQISRVSALVHDPLVGLVEEEAQIEASAAFRALRRRAKETLPEPPRLPAALAATLRPYQQAGVAWLARLAGWGAGAILADEMGLGKTLQTLALLSHRAPEGPALVVAPTSVVGNWVAEAARFTPELRVRLCRGPGRQAALRGLRAGDVVVTSYALTISDAEALGRVTFASLVLDEAQAVKNATTERSKALRGLDARWRLGLTGTPIENHLGELWSLLRVIEPGLLGSWEEFRGRFAVPIEKFGDDGRRRALSRLLRPFVLRRTKDEVARDLPPRTEVVRMIALTAEEEALYEELRRATLEEIAEAKRNPDRDGQDLRFFLLAALTRMRQLCCHPRLVYPRSPAGSSKMAHLLELVAELQAGGHKALVFSQFRSFLELLAPRLEQHGFRVLLLDGTTPAELRERRIAAFQRGEADVFLISLKAGGFGLNLTAADTVIHLDPWWNPAVEDQATARAHRMGQERPVTAIRLVARGTIEEAVLGLHEAKRALAAAVLEGSDAAAALSPEALVDLIRRGVTAGDGLS